MRTEAIAEVGIDGEQRVFVRPVSGDFEQIYRTAMEVYWDRTTRRLSHPNPPKGWTPVRWFRQIEAATADEYGVRLELTNDTVWSNVPADIRAEIENYQQTGVL